jgi:hypothetical protein
MADPDHIAEVYLQLHRQHRSTWAFRDRAAAVGGEVVRGWSDRGSILVEFAAVWATSFGI